MGSPSRWRPFSTARWKCEYPVIRIDALYEKVRIEDRAVSMAVQIVTGIDRCGTSEILAIEPEYQESERTYMALFQKPKDHGLQEVWWWSRMPTRCFSQRSARASWAPAGRHAAFT